MSFAILQLQLNWTVNRVQTEIEKILMLSVVIEAFKKSVMFHCTPFANRCWYKATGLHILHSSSTSRDGIHPVQIHLIGIRDSPEHRSVRNKENKFI